MATRRRVALRTATVLAAAVPVFAVAPMAAASGDDRPLVKVSGGTTAVTLNPDTAKFLTEDLGLDIAPTGRAFADKNGAVNFPVKPSELDPAKVNGQLEHRGGLRISDSHGASIKLSKYDINLDDPDLTDDEEVSDLTAKVNRNRFDRPEIFDLDLSGADIGVNGNRLKVSNVAVNLSAQGAAALNATFKPPAGKELAAGVNIGTAEVKTHIRGPRSLPPKLFLRVDGGTRVSLNEDTVELLDTVLGIKIAPAGAAVPTAFPLDVVFPIVGGRVKSDTLAGRVRHIGALELKKDDTVVELSRFVVNSREGVLTGLVRANGERVGRAPLFALGLDDLEAIANGRDLRLSKVALTLTPGAADLLNGVFETGGALKGGESIGTATADGTVATRFSRSVAFHH